MNSAEDLLQFCRTHIRESQELLEYIVSVPGVRTEKNTLLPFNEIGIKLDEAGRLAGIHANLHPEKAMRDAGDQAEQELQKFSTDLSLNRDLYEAVRKVDPEKLDDGAKRLVEKTVRDFRRSGVDKDEDTRAKIREINEELVKISQEFGKNIREDVRHVDVDGEDDLGGLPEDYIKAHPPGEDGKIRITTDYPDALPIFQYAEDGALREKMSFEFKNRAHPQNLDVLKRLLVKRHELAGLLGYDHWAAYVTEDKMVRTADHIHEFVEKIGGVAKERAEKEYAELLETKRREFPEASVIQPWEAQYYSNKLKEEKFDFDPQSVRPYFEFGAVKQGILELVGDLFDLRFEPVPDAESWHESVDVYDVLPTEGKRMGRIYLDLHPRDGKFKHAAQSGLHAGILDRQIPEGVLMCNFPDPKTHTPALMDGREVTTFLHEFGHLMHHLLAGRHRWVRFSGVATEWDFVEAPSQLLEEWMNDHAVLSRFAKHHETGEVIPEDLVAKMVKASEFGKGLQYRQQMFYAMLSLQLYNQDPTDLDPTELLKKLEAELAPYPHHEGTHFHCNFGHLDGYSAIYYTYAWSQVIAKDLFTPFKEGGLLNTEISRDYRDKVLVPGGSKDAADLVKDFLGREYAFDAFREWMEA